jgi:hypothetical protein
MLASKVAIIGINIVVIFTAVVIVVGIRIVRGTHYYI